MNEPYIDDDGCRQQVILEGRGPASGVCYRLTVLDVPGETGISFGCEVRVGLAARGEEIWIPWGRVDDYVDAPISADVFVAVIAELVSANKALLPDWAREAVLAAVTSAAPRGPDWVDEVVNGDR